MAGSLVSRISEIVAAAFQVTAAKLLTDSVLACSINLARLSWEGSSLNIVRGMATALPETVGNTHS
jgi:hypothetical protein